MQYMLLVVLGGMLMSAAAHKFYVAVFQMDYVPQKKVVQMTARIFVDDLEAALTKKYNKKLYIGQKHEIAGADDFLQKYLAEKITVKVNGSTRTLKFIGKEPEDDVLICYYTLPAEGNIKTLDVKNTVLFDLFADQQNIIHTNINRNKKSLLLTNDKQEGTLDY
jgi:hypothetical protein